MCQQQRLPWLSFAPAAHTRAHSSCPLWQQLAVSAHTIAGPSTFNCSSIQLLNPHLSAAPCPPRRVLVSLTPAKPCVTKGKFTLLSYNLLADLYATVRLCCMGCLSKGVLVHRLLDQGGQIGACMQPGASG